MKKQEKTLVTRDDPTPALIEKTRVLLASAKTLDEILHVRGVAGAAEKFFRAAKDSRVTAKQAAELRLRAERKAGQKLIEMGKTGERDVGRGGDRKSLARRGPVILSNLGIERHQATRWQQIAKVAEEAFESYIAACLERENDELATVGLLDLVRDQGRRQEKQRVVESIEEEEAPDYPDGPFRVLVADPPWMYNVRGEDSTHRARNPYPDMTVAQIIAETPVIELAHADAILWLWTTNAFMRQAFDCLDAWGFQCKTILTWVKDRMGTGDWLRGQTEHCLMASRGKPVHMLSNQTTALVAPMREHSRKPDEFYTLVEAICPGNRVEFYGRQPRNGWKVFGAEKEKFAS